MSRSFPTLPNILCSESSKSDLNDNKSVCPLVHSANIMFFNKRQSICDRRLWLLCPQWFSLQLYRWVDGPDLSKCEHPVGLPQGTPKHWKFRDRSIAAVLLIIMVIFFYDNQTKFNIHGCML